MQSESSSELLTGILADARAEADKLVEQARTQAGESLEGARDRAAKILNGAEDAAAKQGAELKKNSRSALILLKSRQELKSSRTLAAEVMRRVRLRLKEFRKDPAYPALLEELLLEAALGLGVSEALVNGGEAERALMDPGLLKRVEKRLKEELGETVSLSLSEEAALAEQGVELRDREGRRAFRNSFSARLDRKEQQVRDIIEARLQGADEATAAQPDAGSSGNAATADGLSTRPDTPGSGDSAASGEDKA
jgi:vacuolar-type H+-ATPase subunit E/Vma4